MAYIQEGFSYKTVYGGDEGLVLPYREANSQSFKKGDLVLVNAAGDVSLAGADPVKYLGFALKDATNVTSGNVLIPVQVIRPGDVFVANFVAAKTFALADIQDAFEIVRTAAGVWEVDSTQGVNLTRVRVLGTPEVNVREGYAARAGGPIFVSFMVTSGTAANILQFNENA